LEWDSRQALEIQNVETPPNIPGFTWQAIKPLGLSLLRPAGWFYKEVENKGTIQAEITKENIDKEGRFQTGLTVVGPPTSIDPIAYARRLVEGFRSRFEALSDTIEAKAAGRTFVRCMFKDAPHALQQAVQVIVDPQAKRVVIMLFEAPVDSWADAWKKGAPLMLAVRFDSDAAAQRPPLFLTPQDVSSFVQTYYQQPRPELVGVLIKALYSTGVTQKPNAFTLAPVMVTPAGVLTGFLSEVFATNPARLPEWQGVIARQDRSVKPTIERAVAIGKAGGVIAIDGHSASINDLYWGAFFASGRLAFLQKLVDQLRYFDERGDLTLFMAGATSKWSLANNALLHPLVRSTLEAPILKADQRTRDLIRELLAQGPALVEQEIDGVMQRQREAGRWRQSPDPQ
jgi:hypothetical protein